MTTRTCDELAVCQAKYPPCERCKPAEGHESVIRLMAELSKRRQIPLLPRVK